MTQAHEHDFTRATQAQLTLPMDLVCRPSSLVDTSPWVDDETLTGIRQALDGLVVTLNAGIDGSLQRYPLKLDSLPRYQIWKLPQVNAALKPLRKPAAHPAH